ncbi:MAG TPA: hypothetical protein VHO24_21150 [Opitutaceae bacterium]|nr:hypothetical protein [Opitutaceae bacterium]
MTKVVTISNVPAKNKAQVEQDFRNEGAKHVNSTMEPDGEFTIIAIFENAQLADPKPDPKPGPKPSKN